MNGSDGSAQQILIWQLACKFPFVIYASRSLFYVNPHLVVVYFVSAVYSILIMVQNLDKQIRTP